MKANGASSLKPVVKKNFEVPTFELGQPVKIQCQDNDQRHKKIVTFEGDVIFANSKNVTVKGANYQTSFMMELFRTGEVGLINDR